MTGPVEKQATDERFRSLVAARKAAAEAVELLREEAEAFAYDENAALRFWELVAEEVAKHVPLQPQQKPRGDSLARHQRSHSDKLVETRYGGTVAAENDVSFRVVISKAMYVLPKSRCELLGVRAKDNGEIVFDCVRLPEWLAADRNLDWVDE